MTNGGRGGLGRGVGSAAAHDYLYARLAQLGETIAPAARGRRRQ